ERETLTAALLCPSSQNLEKKKYSQLGRQFPGKQSRVKWVWPAGTERAATLQAEQPAEDPTS
ncbi:unnamed protein product, partial [Gulo gulo]